MVIFFKMLQFIKKEVVVQYVKNRKVKSIYQIYLLITKLNTLEERMLDLMV